MGKKTPAAPPAPDPYAVAAAQGKSNTETAVANTAMQNINEYGPYGKTEYGITGYTGMNGVDLPNYVKYVTLSPEQQRLYDLQNQLGEKTGQIALGQADRIGAALSAGAPTAPQFRTIESYYGAGGVNGVRDRAEGALMDRLNPQLQRDQDALENRLVNQGLVRGSEAFNTAADEAGRQRNDARLATIAQAGAEADRSFNMASQAAAFDNNVAQQGYTNAMTSQQLPINQLTALAGLNQMQAPQSQPFQAGQVAGTPVGQYVYQSNQIQQDQYKAKLAAQQASMGALFGLGGSILGGAIKASDERLKTDIVPLGIRSAKGVPLYSYRFKDTGRQEIGVLAQEVETMMPDAVFTRLDGFKAVDYGMVL